ncbi:PREDICTED: pre-rRNA-processing protein TSR2 homolog [Acropora digitifera]|uniref:pre-rRNA-processing protein TSR2 homolog n=1 Tax=Acropora digitifera TaxID=70779 RepID=UPI00077AA94B|nr:PREDICTED: pre-rRNA-processing protein TSR2 homolog [Acropora digitifera]
MIVKYKMADANADILFDSVHFLLNNWPVLQLAVQHGFGGKDSQEKAEWLVSVIDQVLRENDTIENYELEDYIAEILFGEFNTMADDGSLPKVVEKLCRYHGLWKEGKTQQIQQEISSAPKTKLPQFVKQETEKDGSDASDGDSGSEVEEETNTDVYCNGHHEDSRSSNVTVSQTLDQLHISENGTNEQLNNSETENTEPSSSYSQMPTNEEGWEIVRRSKRR